MSSILSVSDNWISRFLARTMMMVVLDGRKEEWYGGGVAKPKRNYVCVWLDCLIGWLLLQRHIFGIMVFVNENRE